MKVNAFVKIPGSRPRRVVLMAGSYDPEHYVQEASAAKPLVGKRFG